MRLDDDQLNITRKWPRVEVLPRVLADLASRGTRPCGTGSCGTKNNRVDVGAAIGWIFTAFSGIGASSSWLWFAGNCVRKPIHSQRWLLV